MTHEQYAADLKVMIKADTEHLADELKLGNRTAAHQCVDAIIDNCRELENVQRQMKRELAG